MVQLNFKKPFEFKSFNQIFYFGLTRLRNTNLGVFMHRQYTRTILRRKNMRQSLSKDNSKFQKFNEIVSCEITRFRNLKLGVFRQ